MASIPASNSEQFPSLQSTESLQPAPGQWRKAWSERKEGEEEGKKNNYRRQEGKKKKKDILQIPAQRRLRLQQEKAKQTYTKQLYSHSQRIPRPQQCHVPQPFPPNFLLWPTSHTTNPARRGGKAQTNPRGALPQASGHGFRRSTMPGR